MPKSRRPIKRQRQKPTDRLKIDGTFEQLIQRSLKAKKPATGWPKPTNAK